MDLHVGRTLSAAEIASLLDEARDRTLALTGGLSEDDVTAQHDPLMSPIGWDLGHIGHFEEVWLLENLDTVRPLSGELRGIYDPFENPRALRADLPLPTFAECRKYLEDVREAVLGRLEALAPDDDTPLRARSFVFRMVLQHEYQHNETILQTLQLKRGAPYRAPRQLPPPTPARAFPEPGTMVRFPGGAVEHGTDDRSAAYDNERPRHRVHVAPFLIDVHPVTNGEYMAFVEDGGYVSREHWSDGGWAWNEEAEPTAPRYWAPTARGWCERFMDRTSALDPMRPVDIRRERS